MDNLSNTEQFQTYEGTESRFRLISIYYTFIGKKDSQQYYKQQCENLKTRCQALGLSYTIYHQNKADVRQCIEDLPIPRKTNNPFIRRRKKYNKSIPFFIEDMLHYYHIPVLYTHVDGQIIKYPPVGDTSYDIILSKGLDNKGNQLRMLGSPVYIKPTEFGFHFLKNWQNTCLERLNSSEHPSLERTVYDDFPDDPRIYLFPHLSDRQNKTKCYIFY